MDKKTLLFSISYVLVISIWLSAALLYPQMDENNIGWFMYFVPLIIALVLAFFRNAKMSYWAVSMVAITPAIEISWGRISGMSISEIMDPQAIIFCFNDYGIPGYIIFIVIIPVAAGLIASYLVKRS